MTLIVRDRAVELDVLDRVDRLSRVDGFADRVMARMDAVEAAGGPDAPAARGVDAIRGAHEEAVDGAAWDLVALAKLAEDLKAGVIDAFAYDEAVILIQDAMVASAHAESARRGAAALFGERL